MHPSMFNDLNKSVENGCAMAGCFVIVASVILIGIGIAIGYFIF